MNKRYDVFLSHSSADKPAVEKLAEKLRDAGINPFLDKWHLVAGRLWQPDLEEGLRASGACVIFVGSEGFGPWHRQEMLIALDRGARDQNFAVIPVLLPGFKKPRKIPTSLAQRTWVELSSLEDEDAFRLLLGGIQGKPPGPPGAEISPASPRVWPRKARLWGAGGISVLLLLGLARLLIPAGPCTPKSLPHDPEAKKRYLEGLQYLSRFDSSEAHRAFEDVLKPAYFAPAGSALAEAYLRLGENGNAFKQAKDAFDGSKESPAEERLEIEARYRRIGGEWDRASDLYLELRREYPNSCRHLEYELGLVESLIFAKKEKEALRELHRMTEASRDPDPRVFLWQAWAAASERNFQLQRKAASDVVEKTKGKKGYQQLRAKALLLRGIALVMLDNPNQALPDLMKAQEYYKSVYDQRGEAQAWDAMARVQFGLGQLELAKTDHTLALAIYEAKGDDQGEANQHSSLAYILAEMGNLEEAQRHYEQALEKFDGDFDKAQARLSLAEIQLEEGHAAKAESGIREALSTFQSQEQSDQVAESQALLARVFLRQGQREKARSAVKNARDLADKNQPEICAEVSLAEAQVHEAFGEHAEALAILDRELKKVEKVGVSFLSCELRFALGEIEALKGNYASLEKVEKQARSKGYVLIANKAAKLLLDRRPIASVLRELGFGKSAG